MAEAALQIDVPLLKGGSELRRPAKFEVRREDPEAAGEQTCCGTNESAAAGKSVVGLAWRRWLKCRRIGDRYVVRGDNGRISLGRAPNDEDTARAPGTISGCFPGGSGAHT